MSTTVKGFKQQQMLRTACLASQVVQWLNRFLCKPSRCIRPPSKRLLQATTALISHRPLPVGQVGNQSPLTLTLQPKVKFNASSSWVMTATGTWISITKQYSYKEWCDMTTLLSDSNSGCCCNPRTLWLIKQGAHMTALLSDAAVVTSGSCGSLSKELMWPLTWEEVEVPGKQASR